MKKSSSYTAASTLPAKVLQQWPRFLLAGGCIQPMHPQISLTNRCNLQCEFCSCAERDRELELSLGTALMITRKLWAHGARALTITGGGEPLLYPHLDEYVATVKDEMGIECGLVTNGILLPKANTEMLQRLTWCRISVSDDRQMHVLSNAAQATFRAPDVDWAFSYVVTALPDIDKIRLVIEIANQLEFTHVRLVSDLLDLDEVPDMAQIQVELEHRGVDCSLVIFQGRKEYEQGSSRCLISLLKPMIGTDGHVYPCCGVQYAMNDGSNDFDARFNMGADIPELWRDQRHFDGSVCRRCYYGDYNRALVALVDPLEHEAFV